MLVAIFMLLGRLTGFLREIVIAQIGGVSQQSDFMIVLLTFPDMMINLLMAGGLLAALVPSFRSLSRKVSFALFLRVFLVIGLIFGALALMISLFSSVVLSIVAPGWSEELIAQSTPLFRITLIALPVTALSGVVVAFLDSKERFAFGGMGTLIFNSSVISAIFIFSSFSPAIAVVIGILGGAMLRLAVQLGASRRFWELPNFTETYDRSGLLRRFAGSFGFFSILALLPPLARAYASLIEPGALSMFNYAYKLMELPMAIIVTAIVTVLLPRLSGFVRDGQQDHASRNLGMALRAVYILLLGVAIPTVFQAEFVVRTVFFGALFSTEQFRELGEIVSLGFVGVPFQGLVLLYGTAFVSYDRTAPLVLVSAVIVATMAGTGLFFQSIWGIKGLMLGYILAQITGAIILSIWLISITSARPFISALDRPLFSIILPGAVCLALSWIFRWLDFWGLPSLLLSSGAFFAIHIWADPYLFNSLINRKKT